MQSALLALGIMAHVSACERLCDTCHHPDTRHIGTVNTVQMHAASPLLVPRSPHPNNTCRPMNSRPSLGTCRYHCVGGTFERWYTGSTGRREHCRVRSAGGRPAGAGGRQSTGECCTSGTVEQTHALSPQQRPPSMVHSGPHLGDATGSTRMVVRALVRSRRQSGCNGSAVMVFCADMGLANMPALPNPKTTDVFLNDNNIGSIPSGTFEALVNLNILNLNNNNIRSIPSGAFEGLLNLGTLYLKHNNIGSITSGAFEGLLKLGTLDLKFNPIGSIPSGAFKGLLNLPVGTLGTLDLQYSKSMPSGAFKGLLNLPVGTLDLKYSDIGGSWHQSLHPDQRTYGPIPSGFFEGLLKLGTLDLKYNNIGSIPSGAFKGLLNLRTLDLKYNNIGSIPSGAFKGLLNLGTLDLKYNKIGSILSGAFEGLLKLGTLDLKYNNIGSIPSGAFGSLLNLVYLRFYGNVLDCPITGSPIRMLFLTVTDGTNKACTCTERHTLFCAIRNDCPSVPRSFSLANGVASCSGQAPRRPTPPPPATPTPTPTPTPASTPCSQKHANGQCWDDTTVTCAVPYESSLCPGAANIRCCPSGKTEASPCDGSAVEVKCDSMGLTDIPALPNPKTIHVDLDNNNIGSIPSGAFGALVNLERLDLANNKIGLILSGAFDALLNLERLYVPPFGDVPCFVDPGAATSMHANVVCDVSRVACIRSTRVANGGIHNNTITHRTSHASARRFCSCLWYFCNSIFVSLRHF